MLAGAVLGDDRWTCLTAGIATEGSSFFAVYRMRQTGMRRTVTLPCFRSRSFSERRAVFPAWQDRASCAIEADAGDVAGLDLTTSQGLRDGLPRRLPPFHGILFCPAGLRVSCVNRRSCKRAAITRGVNDRGPKTLRADVYAEEKRGHGFISF